MPVRSVWLNGTVGVGKTTVGEVLAEYLAEAGDAVAFINIETPLTAAKAVLAATRWPRVAVASE